MVKNRFDGPFTVAIAHPSGEVTLDIFIYLENLTFTKIYFRMGVAQLVGIFVVLVAIGVEASPFAKKVRFFICTYIWTFISYCRFF